jgi:hypothetical protein
LKTMIHEYRTYTLHPHLFARYCELAEQKAIPIRGNEYGQLVAFWISEGGLLCQVHHIWEYSGLDARNAERVRMFHNKTWTDDFIAHAWPTMQRQEVRFMQARTSVITPEGTNVYETRIYRTVVGRFVEMAEAVKARPRGKDTTLVAVYTSDSPEPNEVVEIIAYKTPAARLAAHSLSSDHKAWLASFGTELVDIRATPLLPLPMSPMK